KLSFKYAAKISAAKIIGYINNSVVGLYRTYVLGLMIDWIIAYVKGNQDPKYITYSLIAFGIFYLISGLGNSANNYGNNLLWDKMNYEVPKKLLSEKLSRLSASDIENPEVQNLIHRYQEDNYAMMNLINYFFILIGVLASLTISIFALFKILPF